LQQIWRILEIDILNSSFTKPSQWRFMNSAIGSSMKIATDLVARGNSSANQVSTL
jgi:hypothetical protein